MIALALTTSRSEVIGLDSFLYPDGPLGGLQGGHGFDFDNTTEDGDPISHNGSRSLWLPRLGSPTINSEQLVTDNSTILRKYNGPTTGSNPTGLLSSEERTGVIYNEPNRQEQVVYYLVQVTPQATTTAFHLATYDFETPKILFGLLPGSPNLAINYLDGGSATSTMTPTANTPLTLLTKIDFNNNLLALWANPNLSLPETDPTNSPAATLAYFGQEYSTGLALSSTGPATWDDLLVATSWDDLSLPDFDNDLLPDWWEIAYGTNPILDDTLANFDSDNLNNLEEFLAGSLPLLSDSDNDNLSDSDEVTLYLTNPSLPDSDNDGLTDGEEILTHNSNPLSLDSDSDSDTFHDNLEVQLGTNPNLASDSPLNFPQLAANPISGITNESPVTLLTKTELEQFIGLPLDDNLDLALSLEFTLQWSTLAPDNGLFGWGGLQLNSNNQDILTIGNRWNSPNWSYYGSSEQNDLLNPAYSPEPLTTNSPKTITLLFNFRSGADDQLDIFFQNQRHRLTGNFSFDLLRLNASYNQTLNLLSASLIAQKPLANPDSFTLRAGQTARIFPLANDSGNPNPSTLTITTPPTLGNATINPDGSLTYSRTNPSNTPDPFTYQISRGSQTALGTITANGTLANRFPTNFHKLPPDPPSTSFSLTPAFPGISFDTPHCFSAINEIDANKLFITEADGRVFLIPNVTTPEKLLILDITDRVLNDDNERAMKGIAPHPDFNTNGFIYVTYHHCPQGSDCGEFLGDPGDDNDTVRLSRFTCSTTYPFTADPNSELILIEQENEGFIHGIDSCRFARDGYLYVSFGDEGSQEESFQNSQRIDKDIWSAIIRIDVDKKPGNLEPNPHPAIPLDNGLARFSIPADNPFVGATSFNNQPLIPSQIRTEFYVVGLRNPWQFFPLDIDDDNQTDEIWYGDVGRFDREELTVLPPGGNGEWGWKEGSIPGPLFNQTINGAAQSDATLTPPIWDYPHEDTPFGGNSITAGIYYRGSNHGRIRDTFIFADFVSGNIWSLDNSTPGTVTVERIAGESGIVCIGTNPSTNDLLFLDRNDGIFHRLVFNSDDSAIPATLSETNFFSNLTTLTPNPGAIPYDINLRFWSDHADKQRWFLLNDPLAQLNFSANHHWTFPTGMIWVKHFDLELTRGDPSTSRRLETRFLIKTDDHAYGLSYQWNNITNGLPQTDATLVPAQGLNLELPISENGQPLTQSWRYPSRSACLTCHNKPAGTSLSFNTRQLNLTGSLHGNSDNFLDLLNQGGFLTNYTSGNYPRLLRPDEEDYSLTERVRSYLAVNCAYCHFNGGPASGSWDGRHHLSLHDIHLINQFPFNTSLAPDHRLIAPGEPAKSIIYNRAAAANGYTRMPPLATTVIDPEGTQLLLDWISNEAPPFTSYDEFRLHYFGNLTSPAGDPTANPDGDNNNNLAEFQTQSNPLDRTSNWQPSLT
ncbi:MAG: PQQ-dependent sugar dehydrogenase, partial [Verrucomicrobiota bacterium]